MAWTNRKCRKDKNLHPINSDYDLYSKGRGRRQQAPAHREGEPRRRHTRQRRRLRRPRGRLLTASPVRVQWAFLRSKVARRLLLIFVGCALLPIGVLSIITFDRVTDQLYEQSQRRLHQASKATGLGILSRLQSLAAELEWLEAPSAAPDLASLRGAAERLDERFVSLVVLGADGTRTALLGEPEGGRDSSSAGASEARPWQDASDHRARPARRGAGAALATPRRGEPDDDRRRDRPRPSPRSLAGGVAPADGRVLRARRASPPAALLVARGPRPAGVRPGRDRALELGPLRVDPRRRGVPGPLLVHLPRGQLPRPILDPRRGRAEAGGARTDFGVPHDLPRGAPGLPAAGLAPQPRSASQAARPARAAEAGHPAHRATGLRRGAPRGQRGRVRGSGRLLQRHGPAAERAVRVPRDDDRHRPGHPQRARPARDREHRRVPRARPLSVRRRGRPRRSAGQIGRSAGLPVSRESQDERGPGDPRALRRGDASALGASGTPHLRSGRRLPAAARAASQGRQPPGAAAAAVREGAACGRHRLRAPRPRLPRPESRGVRAPAGGPDRHGPLRRLCARGEPRTRLLRLPDGAAESPALQGAGGPDPGGRESP